MSVKFRTLLPETQAQTSNIQKCGVLGTSLIAKPSAWKHKDLHCPTKQLLWNHRSSFTGYRRILEATVTKMPWNLTTMKILPSLCRISFPGKNSKFIISDDNIVDYNVSRSNCLSKKEAGNTGNAKIAFPGKSSPSGSNWT